MYCTNCGVKLDTNAVFCYNCGHKVGRQPNTSGVNMENIGQKVTDAYYDVMAKPKSRLIAGILAIVLGSAGIHRFYLGYTKKGVAHLLMFVFFLGWASQLWAIYEALMILTGKVEYDGRGIPLTD